MSTLTGPIPVQHPNPPRHPDITVLARITNTANGIAWRDLLTATQARLEIGILRALEPSPWTILDGDTAWELRGDDGKPYVVLTGVWRQR